MLNIALWVAAILLAGGMAMAGSAKLLSAREQLAERGLTYVEDFTDGQIKAIGAVELLGVLGLLLPPALGIAPILAPIAATGLFAMMVGAVVVHVRRKEPFTPAAVLGLVALFVAIGRFWIAPF